MENSEDELICSECNSPVEDEDEICSKCGSDLSEYDDSTLASNKYPSLKNLSTVYKFLALIIFVSTLVSVFYGWNLLSNDNLKSVGIFLIVYSIVTAILSIIILLAISEGIIWMIDMENNSRVHSRLLYKLVKGKR